jgi:hypothetical protein
MTFYPETRQTLIFLHGLQIPELDTLFTELQHTSRLITLPTLFPLHLLSLKAESIDEHILICYSRVYAMEEQPPVFRAEENVVGNIERFDFINVIRMMMRLNATLAACQFACDTFHQLIDRLDEESKCLTPVMELEWDASKEALGMLQGKASFLRGWMHANSARIKEVTQRADTNVQTVSISGAFIGVTTD